MANKMDKITKTMVKFKDAQPGAKKSANFIGVTKEDMEKVLEFAEIDNVKKMYEGK